MTAQIDRGPVPSGPVPGSPERATPDVTWESQESVQ